MRVYDFVVYGASVLQYLLHYASPDSEVKRLWRWSLQRLMACAWQAIPTSAIESVSLVGLKHGPR